MAPPPFACFCDLLRWIFCWKSILCNFSVLILNSKAWAYAYFLLNWIYWDWLRHYTDNADQTPRNRRVPDHLKDHTSFFPLRCQFVYWNLSCNTNYSSKILLFCQPECFMSVMRVGEEKRWKNTWLLTMLSSSR